MIEERRSEIAHELDDEHRPDAETTGEPNEIVFTLILVTKELTADLVPTSGNLSRPYSWQPAGLARLRRANRRALGCRAVVAYTPAPPLCEALRLVMDAGPRRAGCEDSA